jgi:hypothetical protein
MLMPTERGEPRPEVAQLLAEAHAARLVAREAQLAPNTASPGVHELWAYVRREPGAPTSLTIERAIRTDAATGARYRTMLAAIAVAHAPFAIAASRGQITRRRVGACTIEIIEAADAPALLIIHLNGIDRLSMMEIACGDERLRLALPAPAAGTIALSLDPTNSEAAALDRLVRDNASEIFLF